MSLQSVEQLSFDFLPHFPIVVQRRQGQLSSDAGLLPLRQFDQRWNYTERFAQCLIDPKPQRQHSLLVMLRQRLFGILAGYEDCNDHDILRDDPVFKLIADRLPEDEALASQPTLSRFENLATPAVLQKLIDFTINTGIERLKQKHGGRLPASITLDLDATDDPTHGHQQLTLFHGYFGQYQYFPLIISEPTTKQVFVAWLRPGTVHASLGAEDDLMRAVVNALRKEHPDIAIHVRGERRVRPPQNVRDWRAKQPHLHLRIRHQPQIEEAATLSEPLMNQATVESSTSRPNRVTAALRRRFPYQADTWDHPRTLIAKAECHSIGTNLRFVITNVANVISSHDGQREYDHYIQRGESEQRMDELKNGLSMDRLSCHRFMANFFRLLLHTAAFNLLNAARDDKHLPEVLRVGQPCTWRSMLIKVAAVIVQKRRPTHRRSETLRATGPGGRCTNLSGNAL